MPRAQQPSQAAAFALNRHTAEGINGGGGAGLGEQLPYHGTPQTAIVLQKPHNPVQVFCAFGVAQPATEPMGAPPPAHPAAGMQVGQAGPTTTGQVPLNWPTVKLASSCERRAIGEPKTHMTFIVPREAKMSA